MRTNFSADEMRVFDLANDLARGDFSLHVDKEKVTRADLEDYLRNTINNDVLKGATLYQAYRRNNIVLFEIIEEIVNLTISNDFADIPFIDNFVEFKNRALGDKTAWYSEGKSYVTVASFAGNHWDTNREALDGGEEYTLKKEWVYIHVYDDWIINCYICILYINEKIWKPVMVSFFLQRKKAIVNQSPSLQFQNVKKYKLVRDC